MYPIIKFCASKKYDHYNFVPIPTDCVIFVNAMF